MIGVAFLATGILVIGVVVAVALRRWTLDEVRTEAWLHAPQTHTLAYDVPDGQDPAVPVAALTHAGFVARADLDAGIERLLVACEEGQREQVRTILEHADRVGFGGPRMAVGHVRFVDERV